jgi:tetratricopeptide (TPR) repeat protein
MTDIQEQLKQERQGLLEHLQALTRAGQHETVLKIAESMLYEDQNDHGALFYAASALQNLNHEEVAYDLMKKAVLLRPDREEMWQNMGHIADKLWRFDEALYCYGEAHTRNPNNHENLASMASAYVGMGKPDLALIYADRALEINPNSEIAAVNKGFSHLTLGEWRQGWEGYEHMLGHKSQRRKATAYTTPPKFWNLEHENVVIYGEQGLGDEIMFASCIPDAQTHAKHIVIDCHKKLQGLFRRSFPQCSVYGTRLEEAPVWMSHEDIDSSCAIGTLPKFFRNTAEEFPRKPYLVADPERKRMYRALLDGLGEGLKVGISWHGGNTLGGLRKLELDRLQDLVSSFPDIHWVSLNYKDTPMMGMNIHHWAYATETEDYDDTAALVDELDLIITVPQAVAHLAGALGKETWVMAPDVTRWIYGKYGNEHPWYGSAMVFRGWDTMIEQIKGELRAKP